jgi:hypothetical protein
MTSEDPRKGAMQIQPGTARLYLEERGDFWRWA